MSTASDTANTAITAAPTSIDTRDVLWSAPELSIGFIGLFLVTDLAARSKPYRSPAGQRRRLPDFGRNIILARSMGRSSMHPGRPQPTLKQCQTRIAHSGAA